MFGNHCIKTYSQTQETIALPSGESELYGIAKAAATGLGTTGLMEDLGAGELGLEHSEEQNSKERCRASTTH